MDRTIDLSRRDSDHIKILSIFHYVMGGLLLIGMLFLVLHYYIMSMLFKNSSDLFLQAKGRGLSDDSMDFIVWFYVFMGLLFFIAAVGNFLSAGYLKQGKHQTFTLIVAGINCLQIPLGTVLGVFTIVVLMRDTVSEHYKRRSRGGLSGEAMGDVER